MIDDTTGLSDAPGAACISGLPCHILEGIFTFLDCCSLAHCRAVSKSWRAVASAEVLWRRQLQLEFGRPYAMPTNIVTPPLQPLPQSIPLGANASPAAASNSPAVQAALTLGPAGAAGGDREGSGEEGVAARATTATTIAAVAAAAAAAWSSPVLWQHPCVRRQERATADEVALAAESGVPLAASGQDDGGPATDAAAVPDPGTATTAHEVFRRLATCPAAAHLAYVQRLDSVVQGIVSWRVSVALLAPAPLPPPQQGGRQGDATTAAGAAGTSADGGDSGGGGGDDSDWSGGNNGALATPRPVTILRSSLCRCRGVATNPQSVWLRFRLPGWVRVVAQEQPAWEPGLTCGGSGGGGNADGSYMELTVLAEGAQGERWPVMHSSPFRMPQGDRLRLLQSHVEGLYVWDDDEGDDDDDDEAEDDEQPRVEEDAEEEEEPEEQKGQKGGNRGASGLGRAGRPGPNQDLEWGADTAVQHRAAALRSRDVGDAGKATLALNAAGGSLDPGGDIAPARIPALASAPAPAAGAAEEAVATAGLGTEGTRSRPGPHLAAYLHYEQLLPVAPPEASPQGGLSLSLQPPHASHPGYRHYVNRLKAAARRRHRPLETPPSQQPQPEHKLGGPQQLGGPQPEHKLGGPQHTPQLRLERQERHQVREQELEEEQGDERQPLGATTAAGCEGGSSSGSAATAIAVATSTSAATAMTGASSPRTPSEASNGVGNAGAPRQPAAADEDAVSTCTAATTMAPIGYLYIDWSLLPTVGPAKSQDAWLNTASGGDVDCGWVAGCAVRLWGAIPPPLTAAVDQVRPGPDVSLAPPRGQVLVYGDSRRGDIVLLPKLPAPTQPLPDCVAPPMTPLAASSTYAAAASDAAAAGGGRGDGAGGGSASLLAATAPSSSTAPKTAGMACTAPLKGENNGMAARFGAAWLHGFARFGMAPSEANRSAAVVLKDLCTGIAPLMADLALLDDQGRLRLGRCGVEMWTGADGSSTSMHFLLDQLPPRLQLLWDNRLVVQWGSSPESDGDDDGRSSSGDSGSSGGGTGGGSGSGVDQVADVAGNAICGAGGNGDGGPWVRVSLQMPLRNYEVAMAEDPADPEVKGFGAPVSPVGANR